MANKRGQSVPINDFNPRAKPDLGNAGIARIDGSDAAATARAYGGLADQAGRFADRAAILEGRRAGAVAGNDPSFRPSGSATLRGAAEDEAGISSYLNNLDAKLRNSMTLAFQEHQNDPAALKSAFDGIKAGMTDPDKGDVFPEVAASFNASFERLRLPFQIKALDNLQGRQRDEARATAVTAQSAGETLREQVIRAAPQAPATRQAVEATLAEDDVRDSRLVASEALTAEQAAARRIKRRRDAETTVFEATGDTLTTPDAVAAYRKSVQQEFSANKTKLDADGYVKVDAALERREQQLRARGNQDANLVSGTFDKIVKQYAEGIPSNPEEVAAARQRAASVPGGERLVENFDKRLLIASVVKARSPAEIDAMADEITTTAQREKRGLTTEEGARIVEMRTWSKDKRAALAADPLAHARKEGLVQAPPLVVPEKDADVLVSEQLVPRIAAARAAAQAQGGEIRYLTNDDRASLKAVANAGGQRMVDLARGIVQGAGKDASAVLREVGGDMPELAVAGALLASGAPSAEQTARELAEGLALRKVEGAQGARALPDLPKNAPELMTKQFGSAYLNAPTQQAQLMAATKAIYQAKAMGRGALTDSEAETLYQDSLNAAAGQSKVGDADYGGVTTYNPGGGWFGYAKQPVIVPTNVRVDRFRSVVRSLRSEDIAGLPGGAGVSTAEIATAVPVRVRGGYAFALGDPKEQDTKYLGGGGKRLVVDLDAMESVLRKRVPDAYLGGGS